MATLYQHYWPTQPWRQQTTGATWQSRLREEQTTPTTWYSFSRDLHKVGHVTLARWQHSSPALSCLSGAEIGPVADVCKNEVSFKGIKIIFPPTSFIWRTILAITWAFWGVWGSHIVAGTYSNIHFIQTGRLLTDTLGVLLLWACVDSAASRSCSSFFCRKSHRVSGLNGVDPGSPLFLTPYLEKGAIDEGKTTLALTLNGVLHIGFVPFVSHNVLTPCSYSEEAESGRRPARSR